ncbi:MAG: hypothetical protein H7X92_03225 [Chitinophagales bacterium]|nr:hypothetical protein [Hyphomicrobiales bacterium]
MNLIAITKALTISHTKTGANVDQIKMLRSMVFSNNEATITAMMISGMPKNIKNIKNIKLETKNSEKTVSNKDASFIKSNRLSEYLTGQIKKDVISIPKIDERKTRTPIPTVSFGASLRILHGLFFG